MNADDIRNDLQLMRAHNITAVRTSRYPNDTCSTTSAMSSGCTSSTRPTSRVAPPTSRIYNNARYREAYVERGPRMVQRDRNHPSIILWSLGNETGYGSNHDAIAGWIRRVDPSRPLHYEGAIMHGDGRHPMRGMQNWIDGGLPASDIVCPRYPPPRRSDNAAAAVSAHAR